MATTEKEFFGPLTLHQKIEIPTIFKSDEPVESSCVLCDEKFTLPTNEQQFLTHLFMKHRLVIADVNQIADLDAYIRYWRLRFKDNDLPYYCTTMLLNQKPDGTESKDEEYFLLSDVLTEDKELRSHLKQTRLEKLLEQNQFEREDKNYVKDCLFCRHTSTTTRACYLNHLFEKHNFHIAKPDNLIFIDELINLIGSKLDSLQCIFCEGSFKNRIILKEHMRKKGHKRINPDNKEYDKYYLVNYTGNNQKIPKPKTYSSQTRPMAPRKNYECDSHTDSDPDWSEWTEDNETAITCLICDHTEAEYEKLIDHMKQNHGFSFIEATKGMNFYHKVKIVNFIRRQIHLKRCLKCEVKFDESLNLVKHIEETNHWELSKEKWDQPEYYFPTYEDDLFLCFINDEDESWWSSDEQDVERQNDLTDNISKEMALAVLNE